MKITELELLTVPDGGSVMLLGAVSTSFGEYGVGEVGTRVPLAAARQLDLRGLAPLPRLHRRDGSFTNC
jgi:hypothetical protein